LASTYPSLSEGITVKNRRLLVHLAFFTALFALPAPAHNAAADSQDTSAAASGSSIVIPNTRRLEFVSKVNGHRYAIDVALPFEPPPAEGYRVLYVLDGYAFFASATEIARNFGNAPPNVVVVGIGYPDDSNYSRLVLERRGPVPTFLAGLPLSLRAPMLERTYDLTLPASDSALAAQSLPGTPRVRSQNVGGLDDFLKTIEAEIKPRVAALAHIDPDNQALFGHSYGGLAVLHALFVEPNAFHTFIIASPSIWWNNRSVLADESRFEAVVTAGEAAPHVLVSVGSEEGALPKYPASWGIDVAGAKAYSQKVRMVENGKELVEWLKSLHGGPEYLVEDYAVFNNENHSAAAWSALARGIPFAFPLDGGD
jgi:predicted alpha/beta superfamily hydrolase